MITVSIISHKQLLIINKLLEELINKSDVRIILTININEDESAIKKYIHHDRLFIIRNSKVKGFGENHNHAFSLSNSKYFLILNPDVEIEPSIIYELADILDITNSRLISPLSVTNHGFYNDNARKFPSILTPFKRLFNKKSEYGFEENKVYDVDWISGMFMLFESSLFHEIGGFDENFFLYYEDVDICKRITLINEKILLTSQFKVKHHGARESSKSLKYLLIHIRSMIIYHTKYLT
tara:strand:+ start:1406 stop:2119 length:714 start_codon:yes stop_codon:yes gene_type:complete